VLHPRHGARAKLRCQPVVKRDGSLAGAHVSSGDRVQRGINRLRSVRDDEPRFARTAPRRARFWILPEQNER
jgi:hypothetical protein